MEEGRMIRSGLINMIREKSREGKSAYAISQEVGVAENTAKKYIRQPAREHGLKGRVKGSKLDEYKPAIDFMLSQGIFNCVVILERIQAKGYEGGITILKEYVHPNRPARSTPAVRRYETLPGKQAQMDWGITNTVDKHGVIHKLPVFVMAMGSSRSKYVEFTKRCDFYSLLRCIVNAFEYFGGVPETVLTDNMKTVIDGREAGKPLWNSRFEDFAADMGFVPKVCKPRRPQAKGKVERLVDYVKDNFLPGRKFQDIGDLNVQARSWCQHVDSKVHGTTGEIPLLALAKEPLLPLPMPSTREKYRWETRKVTRDGFVSFDGARYGIPWQYSGKEVRVRILGEHFAAYYEAVRIACHKIEHTSGRIVWLKGQYQGLAERNGIAAPFSYARQESQTSVEIRSLRIYDEIAGVTAHG
jgi:transposase